MKKIIEFLFFRWKKEIAGRGTEQWGSTPHANGLPLNSHTRKYTRDFVDYKYTNKFDGSTKIKRVYLN